MNNVNDGNGLWDNQGLCDTLTTDLNNMVKAVVSGKYILFSGIVAQMAQKIDNLKKGIAADLASKDAIIEELKRVIDRGSDDGTN